MDTKFNSSEILGSEPVAAEATNCSSPEEEKIVDPKGRPYDAWLAKRLRRQKDIEDIDADNRIKEDLLMPTDKKYKQVVKELIIIINGSL